MEVATTSPIVMTGKILIFNEQFDREHIPHVARMIDTDRGGAEKQISFTAYIWHDGSIVSAVQALESDLAHG